METKWVMVPTEPTDAMIEAACESGSENGAAGWRDETSGGVKTILRNLNRKAYAAMLSNAPQQVVAEDVLQRAYWLGWRNSAAWADRKDLWADRDSGAYTRERDDDLGTLAAAIKQGKE